MGEGAVIDRTDFGRLSPELRLLAACARWPRSAARDQAIAEAAADPRLDWGRVSQAVGRHRVAGFVRDGLAAHAAEVPPEVLALLHRRASADSLTNLGIAGEAVRLVRSLRVADIKVLVLKGPGLLQLAYGDLAIRQTNDLDLLVPPEAIIPAGEVCEHAGYTRVQPPPGIGESELGQWLLRRKDFIYRHGVTGLSLELHFRPTVSSRLAQVIDLWRDPQEVVLREGLSLPAPSLAALYPYLCVHGALCAWFRLKWLADIAALTARCSDAELEALHAAAVAKRVGRASGQALLLVEAVFDRPLPPALKRALSADRKVRRLARFAFAVMTDLRPPLAVPLRSARVELSHLLLTDDWRVRRDTILSWMIDWPLVFSLKLPRGLWFLYPILRAPAWLWRQVRSSRGSVAKPPSGGARPT